jgi:hypothetical protein
MQVPLGVQHAAVAGEAGQLLGEQVAHPGCQTLGAGQFVEVVIVQVLSGAQQAAVAGGTGQPSGEQLFNSGCQPFGARQFA